MSRLTSTKPFLRKGWVRLRFGPRRDRSSFQQKKKTTCLFALIRTVPVRHLYDVIETHFDYNCFLFLHALCALLACALCALSTHKGRFACALRALCAGFVALIRTVPVRQLYGVIEAHFGPTLFREAASGHTGFPAFRLSGFPAIQLSGFPAFATKHKHPFRLSRCRVPQKCELFEGVKQW